MKTPKEKWIWMPHAGHFILGNRCEFHLTTYVGGYIVSTVGELWMEKEVRKIQARVKNPTWYEANKDLKGDCFDAEFMKKFGYEEVGAGVTFETMVFQSKKSKDVCCPFVIDVNKYADSQRYTNSADATKGHMKLCEKWSKKNVPVRVVE